MKTLQVYDPAMCCSTGVCGPQVDPVLVRFAADVQWLHDRGVDVRRYNLSQNPAAFVENELVRAALTAKGEAALPLVLVDGRVLAGGQYPERPQLADALGLTDGATSLFTPAVKELVAIGAAIAANCDPCLRYHAHEAEKLGVTSADIASAVKVAAMVKDAPHRSILRLAARLTQSGPAATAPDEGTGPGSEAAQGKEAGGSCCS
jgi:AhpD family alkylhydroperoxidase